MPRLKIHPSFPQQSNSSRDDFRTILKPFWALGAVCGIHQHNGEIFGDTLKGKAARVTYISAENLLLILCLYVQLSGYTPSDHLLNNLTQLLSFSSECFAAVAALVSCTLHQAYFLSLKEKLERAEGRARQLPLRGSYGKLRLCGRLILVAVALEWATFLAGYVTLCNVGLWGCLQLWFFDSFPSKIYDVYVVIFSIYVLTVRHLMSVINANLEHICQPVKYGIRHEMALEDIKKLLLELCNIYKIMKKIYRVPMLFIFLNFQVDLFTGIYLFLKQTKDTDSKEYQTIIRLLAFSAEDICILFLLCAVGQSVINEFNEVMLNLHTIPINKSVLLRNKISSFTRHLNVDDFKLSACNVFTLDSHLINRIISTVSFYLILLIQLDSLLDRPF